MHNIKSGRSGLLDILKGIMILFIIITHYKWIYPEDYLKYGFVFYIDMAVPVFMIISGYLAALSFEKKEVRNFKETFSLNIILPKVLRFIVPFSIAFACELPYFVYKKFDVISIVQIFVRGGGRTRVLLYTNNVTIYFYYPSYLFYN